MGQLVMHIPVLALYDLSDDISSKHGLRSLPQLFKQDLKSDANSSHSPEYR
jgi:hypothetical protein